MHQVDSHGFGQNFSQYLFQPGFHLSMAAYFCFFLFVSKYELKLRPKSGIIVSLQTNHRIS